MLNPRFFIIVLLALPTIALAQPTSPADIRTGKNSPLEQLFEEDKKDRVSA